jgi:hypothetical protein
MYLGAPQYKNKTFIEHNRKNDKYKEMELCNWSAIKICFHSTCLASVIWHLEIKRSIFSASARGLREEHRLICLHAEEPKMRAAVVK